MGDGTRRRCAAALVLLAVTLASRPGVAMEWPSPKTTFVNTVFYGTLYGMAVTAVGAIGLGINAVVAPAYAPVALTFGTPAVMVTVMSRAVPWAIATVPPWAADTYDGWFGEPPEEP
ncbi:hypothetical protein HL658_02785 [Azospirillum sp. RWY-5-1]|uniref:Uncharacterized protein n=1 Tax=Azospirillum oleiclasticum TaxID=2735135 RepID=A0ABX2T5Z0_9PROT|nr:hypothetical protein [Azospirillum oleiclasticum]NYZ11462.1 hypothetical protein [Azospirillum oleiclasticum]NYZ18623.1 hypothetical protein [Azospirillum oleiclasticum]